MHSLEDQYVHICNHCRYVKELDRNTAYPGFGNRRFAYKMLSAGRHLRSAQSESKTLDKIYLLFSMSKDAFDHYNA